MPFSPRISTPPISGRTAHSTSASRSCSWPTIALNGYVTAARPRCRRRRASGSTLPHHRHVRNPVVEKLLAVTDKPVMGVHVLQVGLRVDPAWVVADLGQRGLQQPGGMAVAAGAALGADPPDAERLLAARMLLHQPQRGDDLAVEAFQPEVAGLGEQVAPVQLRVRDGLLDDEHLDPQLEQLVERRGVQVLGPAAAQCDRHRSVTPQTVAAVVAEWAVSAPVSTGSEVAARPFAGRSSLSTLVPHDQTSSNSVRLAWTARCPATAPSP